MDSHPLAGEGFLIWSLSLSPSARWCQLVAGRWSLADFALCSFCTAPVRQPQSPSGSRVSLESLRVSSHCPCPGCLWEYPSWKEMPAHCHGMVWTSSSSSPDTAFGGMEGIGECVGLGGNRRDFPAAQFWFTQKISCSLYGTGKEMCSCSRHPVCWKNEEPFPENKLLLCSIAIVLIKALTG